MSFRHTTITEYLYKHGKPDELKNIEEVLMEYGYFRWQGSDGDNEYGYFHGTIKDLDSFETKIKEIEIIDDIYRRTGVQVKIVFE